MLAAKSAPRLRKPVNDGQLKLRLSPGKHPRESVMNPSLSSWRAHAQAAFRVASRTGILRHAKPGVLMEAARQRFAGPVGLPSVMRLHAISQPHRDALVDSNGQRSFAQVDRRADRLANGLSDRLGIGQDDAVVILLPNCAEVLEAQIALGRLGAAAVSLSPRSTADELVYLVTHSGARAVIVDASLSATLDAARPRLDVPEDHFIVVGAERPGYAPYERLLAEAASSRRDGGDPAVVIYTSGTTGKPKGAVRKFPKELVWSALHAVDALPIRADDRHLTVCPLYHSTAFGFLSFTLTLGGTGVISPRFDPTQFLADIERHRITTTAVVPTMLHRVLELPASVRRRYDTRSLSAIFSGGAPLSGTLAARVIEEFGHVLHNFYGATETGLNTLATPSDLLTAPGTIGRPLVGTEIRLLDEAGQEVPDGEVGELWVRSAMRIAGYHDDEAATRASMRGAFFSVGDLGFKDHHGLYHLGGRKRDMVISGGVNVYPAEVEEVLARHPDVAEVAVVGVVDEEWGERVRACVVPRAGFEAAAFLAWSKHHLAGPKAPREVRELASLPKNPTGKVLKRQLRALP
ncbi:MAG: class I adenylate-forming enzyme family protein [Sandaracinaceae bacterium]